MPKVSIIIPIYNVEKYLRRCVDSVLNQKLKDIEIILVDDGSTDSCSLICDQYKEKDKRINVIHKKNGGLASARNAGIKMALGEYIFFLDSDDWIESQTTEELVEIAEKYKVDFVRFRPMYAGWPGHLDGSLCDFGTECGMKEGIYQKEDIIRTIYHRLFATPQLTLGVIVSAWRSLYCREFLRKSKILFDEQIRYSEDTLFSAKVVMAAESFYYLDGPRYYHYFYNCTSITKSYKKDCWENNKKLIKSFEKEFSNRKEYDFSVQLLQQKMYCVVQALEQRKGFEDIRERERYCADICNDLITINAFKHMRLIRVHWKLKIFCILIRLRQSWIIARI